MCLASWSPVILPTRTAWFQTIHQIRAFRGAIDGKDPEFLTTRAFTLVLQESTSCRCRPLAATALRQSLSSDATMDIPTVKCAAFRLFLRERYAPVVLCRCLQKGIRS